MTLETVRQDMRPSGSRINPPGHSCSSPPIAESGRSKESIAVTQCEGRRRSADNKPSVCSVGVYTG